MSQAPVVEVLVGEGLEGTHDPPQASHGINAPGEAPGRPSSSFFPTLLAASEAPLAPLETVPGPLAGLGCGASQPRPAA